jgi:hypothetical protein
VLFHTVTSHGYLLMLPLYVRSLGRHRRQMHRNESEVQAATYAIRLVERLRSLISPFPATKTANLLYSRSCKLSDAAAACEVSTVTRADPLEHSHRSTSEFSNRSVAFRLELRQQSLSYGFLGKPHSIPLKVVMWVPLLPFTTDLADGWASNLSRLATSAHASLESHQP